MEAGVIFRLSLALLRAVARLVPKRQRAEWLQEWESELDARRTRLAARDGLTMRQEVDMFRRVLGSRCGVASASVHTRCRSRA